MRFTLRGVLAATFVLVMCGVCVRLGFWQLDRLAQRRAINARIDTRMVEPATPLTGEPLDPEAMEYRRVKVQGVYDSAQEIVLRNRSLDGAPGVHVLTPLRIAGSDTAVLIDRGWLPLDQAAPAARRAYDEAGAISVEGIARLSQENAAGPRDPPLAPDQVRLDAWFRVDLPRIQAQAGYSLLPIFVEQQPALGDPPLPRRVATTDLGEGPHLVYAIQWFAFAVILLAGYLAFTHQQLRRSTTNTARVEDRG